MNHKLRDKQISRRRNKFFAPSIKNIGKTKEMLFKERWTAIVEKHKFTINPGFDLFENKEMNTLKN